MGKKMKAALLTGVVLAAAAALVGCGKSETKNVSCSFDDAVSEIQAEISWADLTIRAGSGSKISIEAKDVPESFSAEVKDGVLNVTCKAKVSLKSLRGSSQITIDLPEKEYGKIAVKLGAGDSKIEKLSCGEAKLEFGAGDITVSGFKVAEMLQISGGAGDMKVTGCTAGSLDAVLGAGDLTFSGAVEGNAKIKGGAGDVKMTDCTAGRFEAALGAGKLTFSGNVEGAATIKGGAGDVTFTKSTIGGLDAVQGAGNLSFAGTINGDIKVKGAAGDLTLNLTNAERDFASGGKYKLDIVKASGKKTINYNTKA